MGGGFHFAGLAQLVEHFTCNEDVAGSIPATGPQFARKSSTFSDICLSSSTARTSAFQAEDEGSIPS